MLDKHAIQESADIQVVAEELGIPMRQAGKNIQILCPCHDDKHFGSAYIYPGKNTFRCYSCGARGDVFALVQAALNVGFTSAEQFVAETCGGASQFEMSDKDAASIETDRALIPRSDQNFIGLHSGAVYTISYTASELDDIDENDQANAEDLLDDDMCVIGYAVKKKAVSNPLYQLLKDDPDTYHELIDQFCMNTVEKYSNALKLFQQPEIQDPSLARIVYTMREIADYSEILQVFSKYIKRAQKISAKYGSGSAVSKTETETIRMASVLNSVWAKDEEAPF